MIEAYTHRTSILVFSAAYPGQRGRGHINCAWPWEWAHRLHQGGSWHYRHLMTAAFHHEIGKANRRRWVVPECYLNTMVFTQ